MRSRRRRVSAGESGNSGNQLLALALFIMLLAFFIVLNTMASYEEAKVKPIINSVSMAFASRLNQQGNEQPSPVESVEKSAGDGDTIDKVKAVFSAQIPDFDSVASRRKGMLQITIDWNDLENATLAIARVNEGESLARVKKDLPGYFLPTLVALMLNDETSNPLRMDVFYNLNDNPAALQNKKPEELQTVRKKLSDLSERLERAGLPTKLFSVGVRKGKKSKVDLLFSTHRPFDPTGQGGVRGQ